MLPPESGSTRPDSFDKVVIRRVVHGFYLRKEYPTLSKVLGKVKEACSFPGGKFCLWRNLREKGFAYIKRDRKRFFTNRSMYICSWIKTYLPEDSTKIKRRKNSTLTYWRAFYP